MENIILSQISLTELKKAIEETIHSELEKRLHSISKPQEQAEFITRKDAAKLLGISLPTLLEWTKKGIITGYRISSRIRYRRNEIEASLSQIKSLKTITRN